MGMLIPLLWWSIGQDSPYYPSTEPEALLRVQVMSRSTSSNSCDTWRKITYENFLFGALPAVLLLGFWHLDAPWTLANRLIPFQPLSRSRPMIRLSGIEWMCSRKTLNRNSARCSSLVRSASSTPTFGGPCLQSSLRWGCSYRLTDCVLNGNDLKQRFLKVHQ